MRTSELIVQGDPNFTGWVIGTVEIAPNVFRLRRIPPNFLGVPGIQGVGGDAGPVGPTGPIGPTGPAGPEGSLSDNMRRVQFGITIDGGGSAVTTGIKGYLRIPKSLTITGWEITADQSGSIVVDVWKDTYANYPPTVADTIVSGVKPTLSAAQKNQNLALNIAVTAGDYAAFKVDSAATVTLVQVSLFGTLT